MADIVAVVAPNSRAFSAEFDSASKVLKVRLTEPAEKGKANLELVKGLSKLLGCGVSILRGHTGRRKLLRVGLDEAEVAGRLAPGKQG
jgi:uncharacterized protein (TIGR00251 family)